MKILPPVQFLLQESSVNGHRAEEAKRIEHYEGATSWSQIEKSDITYTS